MFKLNKARTVFCDVDDTIILWDISKYESITEEHIDLGDKDLYFPVIPHRKNIALLTKLKLQGCGIVVWSAAGVDWAEKVVTKLNLTDIVDVVVSKPEIAIDDLLQADRIIKSIIWIDPVSGEMKRNG